MNRARCHPGEDAGRIPAASWAGRPGLLTVVLLLLAGCAASIPHVPTQNILMFNADGRAVDPTGNVNCAPAGPGSTTPCHETAGATASATHSGSRDFPELDDGYFRGAYLDSLFACMQEYVQPTGPADPAHAACKQEPRLGRPAGAGDRKRLMVFVHGGLNTQVETVKRVVQTWDGEPLYSRIAGAGYYPVFVNWQASFTSSYLEQLLYVRQGEKSPRVGVATAAFVFVADLVRSILGAPLVWVAQTTNDLKTVPELTRAFRKDADEAAIKLICAYEYAASTACPTRFRFGEPGCFSSKSPERSFERSVPFPPGALSISVGEDRRTCGEMTLSAVSYLVTEPTRLALEPVVDVFGTSAWDNMLRRTRLLYNVDAEFSPASPAPRAEPRSGGLSTFLRRLAQETSADHDQWEVTLVAHSMGAIIVNQMLRETMALGLEVPIKNIVYMAAAAPVRDVLDSVLPFLRTHRDAHFYNLTLHPVADERESYRLKGLPLDPGPRGSLLVLIDNFLSRPLTYLDRTAGRYDNFVVAAPSIPEDLRPRVHLKTFSAGQTVRSENPQQHADFTHRFRFWMEDCWKPEPAMDGTRAVCVRSDE